MYYDDLTLGIVLEEEFGRTIQCKGGGGSSGAVSYPGYMQTQHSTWLTAINSLVLNTSSPFVGEASYDPDADITAITNAVNVFSAAVSALSVSVDYENAIDSAKAKIDTVVDDTHLNADIAAYAAILDDDINNTILPQFQSGMRDVNAVMTSAFVMGEAKIWARKSAEINKYATALRLEAQKDRNKMIIEGAKAEMDHLEHILDYQRILLHYTIEGKRIKIAAKKEQMDGDLEIAKEDALWTFELYQYAGNMLAAISGGTGMTTGNKPSTAKSVFGGALSGAATGAMMGTVEGMGFGSVPGAIGGAIIGGLGGLLS